MNNSKIAIENRWLETEELIDTIPLLRQQATELATIIEALEKVQSSSYWKVLEQKIFTNDLISLRSRLSKEKDTTEIFRLQGKITQLEKYDFGKMLSEKRNELSNITKQLHA